MSDLLTRKRVLKVSVETVKGTSVAATSALRVEDPICKANFNWTERGSAGVFMGNEQSDVPGPKVGQSTFVTELKGNGAGGADAGLAVLLQGIGLLKTSEVYNAHSLVSAQKALSLEQSEDGKLKGLAGAMGNAILSANAGERAILTVTLDGIYDAVTDVALPANAPGAETPLFFQNGTVTFGGVALKIASVSLDFGMAVFPKEDAAAAFGVAYFKITDHMPTISIDPEDELVAAFDYEGIYAAGSTSVVVLTFTNGTDKCTIDLPAVQMVQLDPGDRNGSAIYDINGKSLVSSGNDDLKLTFAAA